MLTLHGAGVDAWGQAGCYAPKPDLWIVAPTNRRSFGFDWQDWGRRDAYDVLERELAATGAAEERVYVTGHSMGGHGTWHLAANDPDRFAACAPSAGWVSFDSYGGGRPAGELRELWHAADRASLTLDLVTNLVQLPTYIEHGSADRTVPVGEALTMAEALARGGATFDLHVRGGAGHWYGGCVDWKPIFDTFRASVVADDPVQLDFTSVDPGVDSRHHWVRVERPHEYGEKLRVRAARDTDTGVATVTTENVGWLALERELQAVVLDEQSFDLEGPPPYRFLREGAAWSRAHAEPAEGEKRAGRCGPFKRAFDSRFVFVYGTAGDAAETAQLFARARYDAQVWWYRGNGRSIVLADEEFLELASAGRNVILYGNEDTNSAWPAVLDDACPVRARRGVLRVGSREVRGEAVAAAFVYPRRGEGRALVGVFADTGTAGARLGYTLSPFVSGAGSYEHHPVKRALRGSRYSRDPGFAGPDVASQGIGGAALSAWWHLLGP